jgi:hypothetical protein
VSRDGEVHDVEVSFALRRANLTVMKLEGAMNVVKEGSDGEEPPAFEVGKNGFRM